MEKRNEAFSKMIFNYRLLEERDLEQIYLWLTDRGPVQKWYARQKYTKKEVFQNFRAKILKEIPTQGFLVEATQEANNKEINEKKVGGKGVGGKGVGKKKIGGKEEGNEESLKSMTKIPVGYIQRYRIQDWPNYAKMIKTTENWGGIDYCIGNSNFRSKGYSTVILSEFIKTHIFADFKVTACVAGPDPRNIASIKALQKVGFQLLKQIVDDQGEQEQIMIFRK